MPKLNQGDKMPDLPLIDAWGNHNSVYHVLKGKTVFWVLRYIGCTVCRYDLHQIAARYDDFLAKGAQVLVVLQSDPAHVQADLAHSPLPFSIICDSDLQFYRALDIAPAPDLDAFLGADPARAQAKCAAAEAASFTHGDYEGEELQLPALFLVRQDGTVSYAHYGKDTADMPSVDQVLTLLSADV